MTLSEFVSLLGLIEVEDVILRKDNTCELGYMGGPWLPPSCNFPFPPNLYISPMHY